MHRPKRTTVAALLAAAMVGAGGGAGTYASLSDGGRATPVVVSAAPTAPAASTRTALSANEIYNRTQAGVVEITAQGVDGGIGSFGPRGGGRAQGSGFVYDASGHLLTNEHVVDGASSVLVLFADGTTRAASVVGADPSTDIAVLKVDVPAGSLHPLTLADSGAVRVGDPVVAIGSPLGYENSLTTGVVSGLHRRITAPNNFPIANAIQTDAAINHGNSGGPLLDASGRVIGITAQIASDSGGFQGIGFAIPSNTVKSIARQLISTGRAEHAYLGVQIATIPSSVASALGEAAGVAVAEVRPDTPASAAGLQGASGSRTVAGDDYPTGGDVITAVNGKKVATAEELQQAIDGKNPGDKVSLTVVRGGKTRTVELTLGSRPS